MIHAPRSRAFGDGRAPAWLSLLASSFALAWACSSEDRPSGPRDLGFTSGNAGSASAGAGGRGQGGTPAISAGAGGAPAMGGSAGLGAGPACTPSESCRDYCAALGPEPACGIGDRQQCECVCEERLNGACPTELAAVLSCVGDDPISNCGAQGRLFQGCEDAAIELELCDVRVREQLCGSSQPLCMPYCRGVRLSFCGQASESVVECLCGCEQNAAGRCPTELAAFMSCTNDAPSFACDADGELVPNSCPSEWQALQGCLASEVPDAG